MTSSETDNANPTVEAASQATPALTEPAPAPDGAVAPGTRSFLPDLGVALAGRNPDPIYPCIQDLLVNGLDLTRFVAGEARPNRQEVTAFLAAWSRHAGLTEPDTAGWLVDYSTSVLAILSKRSLAAIRHSTKSNIRYIYRSSVPFLCGCASNTCKARCCTTCPVFPEMQAAQIAKQAEARLPRSYPPPQPPVYKIVIPTKVANREQFEAAMRLAAEQSEKGMTVRHITNLLNEAGFKTKTGKKWAEGILGLELRRWLARPEPPQIQTPDVPNTPATEPRSGAGTVGA